MKRAYSAAALALFLVVLHATLRALGLAAHTSAIAGMPIDASSLPIAALYVVTYLGAIVLAPILTLAAFLYAALLRLKPEA
jgi:hypothetical protein